MRMYDLIVKKRNGGTLTREEIAFMVRGYTDGEIPDYQMSAMMMAVYFQGTRRKRCPLPCRCGTAGKCST